MKLQEILKKTTDHFKLQKIESAKLDAELLISHILHLERSEIYQNFERELSNQEMSAVDNYVQQRSAGMPVAYILGYKDFYKSRFKVNKNVLVPRSETEHLVEEALEWVKKEKFDNPLRIIDLGSGSGCLGLSLLSEWPEAELLSVDISAEAIEVARENAKALGLLKRTFFLHKDGALLMPNDLPKPWVGQCDIVVANPPYIALGSENITKNVRDHEPHIALFSGQRGLEHIELWAERAASLLKKSGGLFFEIGFDQGPAVHKILNHISGLEDVEIKRDYSGLDRIAIAKKVKEWTQ